MSLKGIRLARTSYTFGFLEPYVFALLALTLAQLRSSSGAAASRRPPSSALGLSEAASEPKRSAGIGEGLLRDISHGAEGRP